MVDQDGKIFGDNINGSNQFLYLPVSRICCLKHLCLGFNIYLCNDHPLISFDDFSKLFSNDVFILLIRQHYHSQSSE